VKLRVSFDLSADDDVLAPMLEAKGASLNDFRAEAVDRLREDLEREIGPSDDWHPFALSPFEIQLIEGA
jgi:hypothetical protein